MWNNVYYIYICKKKPAKHNKRKNIHIKRISNKIYNFQMFEYIHWCKKQNKKTHKNSNKRKTLALERKLQLIHTIRSILFTNLMMKKPENLYNPKM